CLVEAAGDVGHRGEEDVAEGVTLERRLGGEAIVEEAREQLFLVGEGDDAVADVAGRRHPELFAQDTRAAAFIGDGDDRRELRHRPRPLGVDVLLQTAEESGKAGSAADRNDVEAVAHDRYFFFNSVRTSFATAFSVSKTPVPFIATASNVGSPLKLSWRYISSA